MEERAPKGVNQRVVLLALGVALLGLMWRAGFSIALVSDFVTTLERNFYSVKTDQMTVHYFDGATPDDARLLGQYWTEIRPDLKEGKLQISKPGGTYAIGYPGWIRTDERFKNDMLMCTMEVSDEKFGGVPMRADFCDDHWVPQSSCPLTMTRHATTGVPHDRDDGLWYGADIPDPLAHSVAAALVNTEFAPYEVGLSRDQDRYVVWVMMEGPGWDRPENERWMRKLAAYLTAGPLPGASIILQICGGGFIVHKTIVL